MKKHFGFLILFFGVGIICCSQNTNIVNGIQLYTISGEPYIDSFCEIEVGVYSVGEDNELIFQNCTVENGKLFLSIPDNIQDVYLSYDDFTPYIKRADLYIQFKDSIGYGIISLALRPNNETSYAISFIYSDRNAAIPTLTLWDGNQKIINYKKGWNMIDWIYCENPDDIQSLYDMGYKWYIYYYDK